MRVLDDQGRVFGLVNVVDVLAITVLVAIVFAGLTFVFADGSAEQTVRIEVEATDVEPYVVDALDEGTAADEGIEIVGIETRPSTEIVQIENGTLVEREYPRLQTVTLELQVAVDEREGTLYYDGQPLFVGDDFDLVIGHVRISGNVTAIAGPDDAPRAEDLTAGDTITEP